uniref:Uncharacterized protein n=1 Tax=Chelydra serpentina TaxID=8475 RepID=A0A8C3T5L2_CHESE
RALQVWGTVSRAEGWEWNPMEKNRICFYIALFMLFLPKHFDGCLIVIQTFGVFLETFQIWSPHRFQCSGRVSLCQQKENKKNTCGTLETNTFISA